MEKEQVILRFVKINKILKCARCLIDTGTIDIEESFPDLIHLGEWAEEIQAHWEVSKDDYTPIELNKIYVTDKYYKISQMPNMISVAQRIITMVIVTREVKDSLSKFVEIMTMLKANIEDYQRKKQGKLFNVPEELQSNEAIRLLDLCVKENLLDDHYQPTPETKRFQLLLIAYGIGISLKMDPIYTVFEDLWKIKYLRHQSVPKQSKADMKDKVKKLFPKVEYKI
jgi:hypothetical protein